MSAPGPPSAPEFEPGAQDRFALSSGGKLELADDALKLRLRRKAPTVSIPYDDLTHVDASDRGLWLGTRKKTMLLRRTSFRRAEDAEEFVRALGATLGGVANGGEILERMRAVSQRVRSAPPQRASTLIVAGCVVVFLLQLAFPLLVELCSFVPALVREGELWRIVTWNFVHEFSLLPFHLLVNMMCLMAFGLLVERPLGSIRTFLIMAIGAVGAMLGSTLAGYTEVIGASGIVAALGGAVLWLELNAAEYIAAWWRLPRRLFIGVLLLQAAVDFVFPQIAGGAHFGGFVAGYLATGWVRPGAFESVRPAIRMQQLAGLFALLTLVSFVSAGQLLFREGAALEHHAERLLALPDTQPVALNDFAWKMATEYQLTESQLDLAVRLARRAVDETKHEDPDYLDTLAELLFIRGDIAGAVVAIDQAIALTGSELYFHEQRRRFIGERAADDRPAGPTLPWAIRKRFRPPWLLPSQPGVAI